MGVRVRSHTGRQPLVPSEEKVCNMSDVVKIHSSVVDGLIRKLPDIRYLDHVPHAVNLKFHEGFGLVGKIQHETGSKYFPVDEELVIWYEGKYYTSSRSADYSCNEFEYDDTSIEEDEEFVRFTAVIPTPVTHIEWRPAKKENH